MKFFAIIIILINFVSSLILDCDFAHGSGGYQCKSPKDFTVPTKNERIDNVTGYHTKNYSNINVTVLNFSKDNMSYLPVNLFEFFPSVTSLIVDNKFLMEINGYNIEQFKNLDSLHIKTPNIRKLNANFLENNRNLSSLMVEDAVLFSSIHPQLIVNSTLLTQITFTGKNGPQKWDTNYSLDGY